MNFNGNPINALIWLIVFLVVIFVLLRILGIVL